MQVMSEDLGEDQMKMTSFNSWLFSSDQVTLEVGWLVGLNFNPKPKPNLGKPLISARTLDEIISSFILRVT
jgi:hypothetical protein